MRQVIVEYSDYSIPNKRDENNIKIFIDSKQVIA